MTATRISETILNDLAVPSSIWSIKKPGSWLTIAPTIVETKYPKSKHIVAFKSQDDAIDFIASPNINVEVDGNDYVQITDIVELLESCRLDATITGVVMIGIELGSLTKTRRPTVIEIIQKAPPPKGR